ncbi:hypothetical protein PFLmoz3_05017 [Pseudomonas fluorescens]|uniref:Uncharacterized protein n=1 Tax=Pseudomonas fluorescens TaxID=294 RepID=A0A109LD15_PSEFL|nr:hypothetical protein PFLmoz3_05017 [Pseudomonas fluorescens]
MRFDGWTFFGFLVALASFACFIASLEALRLSFLLLRSRAISRSSKILFSSANSLLSCNVTLSNS